MNGRITAAIATGFLVVVLAVAVAAAAGTAVGEPARTVDGNPEPPHGMRPIAATQPTAVPVDPSLRAKAVTVAALQEQRRLTLFFALVERAQREDVFRAAVAQAEQRRAASRPVRSTSGGGGGSGALDCIRHRESRGDYGVTNRSSGAAGAYQFMPSTWNATARAAGRSDLVGVNPAAANPADQDAMAQHLLATRGLGPWGGGCH